MTDLGFIIIRHINSEKTSQYWKECLRSIRRFYPNQLVMIIDDQSNQEMIDLRDINIENCFFIRSEFPGCGEFLGYYYFNLYKLFRRAVILHDSVFFQEYIDFDSEKETFRFLWHFVTHFWDNDKEERSLLSRLKNHDELIDFYTQKSEWNGCFGLMCYVTSDFIDFLQQHHEIFNLIPHVKDRQIRSCMERIIGMVFTFYHRRVPSVLGDILEYIPWGYEWDLYLHDRGSERLRQYPLVKIWTGR